MWWKNRLNISERKSRNAQYRNRLWVFCWGRRAVQSRICWWRRRGSPQNPNLLERERGLLSRDSCIFWSFSIRLKRLYSIIYLHSMIGNFFWSASYKYPVSCECTLTNVRCRVNASLQISGVVLSSTPKELVLELRCSLWATRSWLNKPRHWK